MLSSTSEYQLVLAIQKVVVPKWLVAKRAIAGNIRVKGMAKVRVISSTHELKQQLLMIAWELVCFTKKVATPPCADIPNKQLHSVTFKLDLLRLQTSNQLECSNFCFTSSQGMQLTHFRKDHYTLLNTFEQGGTSRQVLIRQWQVPSGEYLVVIQYCVVQYLQIRGEQTSQRNQSQFIRSSIAGCDKKGAKFVYLPKLIEELL
eukprot:TRINITY_DN690_c1_g1_i1.p2 TRINITY_DN690_c1_g1~~TRINITY_DN690_c1_g1_i1.p2  ORF type:complete len:203 (+),score=4.24 TRINITY_DN690_c1_g1_i1:364-972(+)